MTQKLAIHHIRGIKGRQRRSPWTPGMYGRKPVVIRPIRWNKLRTDEAEAEIKRRLDISDPFVSPHAFDRMDERGDLNRLNTEDMLWILREGSVREPPRKER